MGGLFKTSYVNKEGHREWLITKHNTVTGTRRLFPCWDEPRFKANFSINLKYHNNYSIFSNMQIAKSRLSEKDMIVARFATTPSIPTYLITILLIRFSESSFNFLNYKLWGRFQAIKYLTYADGITKKVIDTFENEQPYIKAYLNENHFAIPGWLEDGMDKWHIVFYREENIMYDDEIDPTARKIEISRLIVRKVAGQWIGSAIYSSQWSNMWLHESISTLLGINVLDKTVPDFRVMDLFVVQTLQESLRLDNNTFMKSLTSGVNNISEINSLFSFAYYLKGPVILRMLQHVLSNKVFQEGINNYLKLQLSSLDSFWTVMQAASDKSTVQLNINEVMDSWLNQNYYPILNIEPIEGREIFELSVQTAHDAWWIPVTYSTPSMISVATFSFWLKTPTDNLSRKEKIFFSISSVSNIKTDCIILNLQQTGYYRVNYYTEKWRAIADYLSSKNYTNVHVLNRAQIIDDAFYFMITNQLEPSIFWKLTNFLSRESDYIVWYPMFKAIEYMYSYPFDQSRMIKADILKLLGSLLDKIGYEEHSEENHLTKCLRQEAAKWACVLGDDECQSKAKTLLSNHLSNPKYYHVVKKMTHVKTVIELTELFTSTLPSRERNVRRRIYINMFHRFVQRHAKNKEVLVYILSIWKDIRPKVISSTTLLIDIINHVYSRDHLEKIREFLRNLKVTVNYEAFGIELISLNEQTIDEIIKNSYLKEFVFGGQKKIDIRLSQIKKHIDSVVF